MKTQNFNPQQFETLARYFSGEMDENELAEFEKQLADFSDADKKMTEKMKTQWKAMESFREPALPDTRKAWNKLHSRLINEDLVPVQKTARPQFVPVLLRIAAVLLLLAGLGAALYWGISRKPGAEMVQINTMNEANTLIKTLADGSVVYLAGNSVFSFPKEFEPNERNVELKGEAFFDITPDPQKPFIIETNEARIEVLGTAFNVKTKNGGNFELAVTRGKVKVTMKNNAAESELVTSGEMVTSVNNHVVKSKAVKEGSSAWYVRRMQFKDETLQNIINVLNRNFNTTFAAANQEIGNRKLTVTFSGQTSEAMAELICAALNLKCQNTDGKIILSDNASGSGENRR